VVHFHSGWALLLLRYAFAQSKAFWGCPMSRLGQHEVSHEGVTTGRDGFSLRSSIADPQEPERK